MALMLFSSDDGEGQEVLVDGRIVAGKSAVVVVVGKGMASKHRLPHSHDFLMRRAERNDALFSL